MGEISFPFLFLIVLKLIAKKEMSLTYNTAESIEDYVTCLRGTYTTGKIKS